MVVQAGCQAQGVPVTCFRSLVLPGPLERPLERETPLAGAAMYRVLVSNRIEKLFDRRFEICQSCYILLIILHFYLFPKI